MKNTYADEIIGLLGEYSKLSEKIREIKSSELLREDDNYRNLLRIEYELKNYVLNGEEIIEIYKYIKNISDVRYDSIEKEYQSKINDLEEVVSNLKDSKDNLRKLILDYNNFFNGKIVEEIKKELNK